MTNIYKKVKKTLDFCLETCYNIGLFNLKVISCLKLVKKKSKSLKKA